MPPRFAYWTIIVDNQATSFRSASIDELMPTFKRYKAKHPSTVMMWFQNGRLWPNRLDAQEAMRARGEQSKRTLMEGDGFSRRRSEVRSPREARSPRPDLRGPDGKLVWKPKGSFEPEARRPRSPKPEARSLERDAERRDPKRWRPGGDHKDPRQKYKDAKKAKWTRFKQTIRARSSRPPKKRDRR